MRPAPFRLLPFFSIASLIGIVAAAVLVTLLHRHTAVADLVAVGERQNVALAQASLNSARDQLLGFLQEANTAQAPPGAVERAALAASLDAILRHTGVVRVKVYNQGGLVVYSTDPGQIGHRQADNPGVIAALAGRIASKLVYRDTFNLFDQVTEDDNLIQTYLPIGGNGLAPVGVLEIYTDVNALAMAIERTELLIIGGTGAIFLLLYVLLLAVVHSAGKIIAQQQVTIAERNRTLELLSARLLEAQEKERQRVAHGLHEGIAQTLAAIKFRLEGAGQRSNGEVYAGLVGGVQEAMQEVRTMAMQLRPPSLDDLGLGATLTWLGRQLTAIRPEVAVTLRMNFREDHLAPALKVTVYRVVQDVLAALIPGGGARSILLELNERGDTLVLLLHDPLLAELPPGQPDLPLAQQRILMSGGTFRLEADPADGSVLQAIWPL